MSTSAGAMAWENRAGRSGFVKVREVRNYLERLGGKRGNLYNFGR